MRLLCIFFTFFLCVAPISLRLATAAPAYDQKQGRFMKAPQDDAIDTSIQRIDDLQKAIKKMETDMDKVGREIKKIDDEIAKKEQEKQREAAPPRSSVQTKTQDAVQFRSSVDKGDRRIETDMKSLRQSIK